jgi:DNA-binding CsgD family transcriptional regulator
MTRNGRSADAETSDNSQADEGSGQSSGVFRAAHDMKRRDSGWTVAEQFVREGFSYRLMRRPLELSKAPPKLTRREDHAVVLACAGHTNKSIAQVMDVSPSTVGVLLFRAAAKLNAKSRSELLSNYEQFKVAAALSPADEATKQAK